MSIFCDWFGHKIGDRPEFTDNGTWSLACGRECGFIMQGCIPQQHIHSFGPKYKRDHGWIWKCACGHTEEAPAPVPRKVKGESHAQQTV